MAHRYVSLITGEITGQQVSCAWQRIGPGSGSMVNIRTSAEFPTATVNNIVSLGLPARQP